MTDFVKIAVDAMGGDGSPKKIIDGLIYNHNHRMSATAALKHPYFKELREQDRI